MDNVNLKMLAKELNLAVSTVSRALRDSYEISQETKDRVQALAAKLGFQPNPHASSLRQHKSKTIAVIIPEIENNFFSQVMNGVESIAQEKGYHVLIYLTHEDYNKEQNFLQLLRNGRVDGLMISFSNTTSNFSHLEACNKAGIPIVMFDRVSDQVNLPKIITDDAEIAFVATEHLLKRGCKKIAFLGMSGMLSIISGRKAGYLKALEKSKGRQAPLVAECSPNDEQNRQIIRKLLKSAKPDGVFAAIEKIAINTYEVCNEMGIEIPRQLKVVCFSNSSAAALFNPSLSTVMQPAFDIGQKATSILFKIIEKKVLLPNEKIMTLKSTLVERCSTTGSKL